MRRDTRCHFKFLMAAAGSLTAYFVGVSDAAELTKEQALEFLSAKAQELCKDIPLEENRTKVELTGEGKAELDKIIKKFVDLNVAGAAKYTSEQSKGVLQQDIARVLHDSADCKLEVLRLFHDDFFPRAHSQTPLQERTPLVGSGRQSPDSSQDKQRNGDHRIEDALKYMRLTSEAARQAQKRAREAAQRADRAAELARNHAQGYAIIPFDKSTTYYGEFANGNLGLGVVLAVDGDYFKGTINNQANIGDGYGVAYYHIGHREGVLPGDNVTTFEGYYSSGKFQLPYVSQTDLGAIIELAKCGTLGYTCINVTKADGSKIGVLPKGTISPNSAFKVAIDWSGKVSAFDVWRPGDPISPN